MNIGTMPNKSSFQLSFSPLVKNKKVRKANIGFKKWKKNISFLYKSKKLLPSETVIGAMNKITVKKVRSKLDSPDSSSILNHFGKRYSSFLKLMIENIKITNETNPI